MSKAFTPIERRADEATKLDAFPININNIRGTVEKILSEWKSSGFFLEYTDHSFNHVTDMLLTADWVIPEETKNDMTPADWLMLVLSIYFHDIGLLITRKEYDGRVRDPDYKSFLDNPILPAEKHAQFVAKLNQLAPEEADRLRYQEYVRYSHGKRVKGWIEGSGFTQDELSPLRQTIEELLRPLNSTIRRDLGLLCESHTLNDISNTTVFKTSQPYGGLDETVNLQYCAAILRTIDLLQITQRRAPAVLFQLINPSDPVSQIEWQKQGAVRSVRPALGRDRDGNVSGNVLSDTIEVHATFSEPDGFFGLTSFLAYAQKEISQTHAAIQKSAKDVIKKYVFPWRLIDTSSIDTDGFLTDSFEFELDQHKILDLLTGHTLYNDTSVVLRELTQNALDAVRLQCEIEKIPSETHGTVEIRWEEKERALTITDNGTGMSQEVIENHLLKVGSSRYQDAKFKEKHPNFHSISRFGIGVLSAFMVSDDVEITTCSEDEDRARRIALRSVHGKYLIKLLDKMSDRDALPMYPHGTSVRMILRPLAEIGDVLKIAKSWLVFPRCKVTVAINDEPPIVIGYGSPKEALESYLNSSSTHRSRFRRDFDVKQISSDGITLAFAVAKDELFKDWSFVDAPRPRTPYEDDETLAPIGTCIEGVAVESDTPGFRGKTILAIVNATGPKAPKTNVARSALEDTVEQRDMLRTVYQLYSRHISDEIERLSSSDGHSLSRAVSMAPWIASPLLGHQASKPTLLTDAMSDVSLVLVEEAERRRNISFKDLAAKAEFWTVESPLNRSVEYFIKEAPADVTSQKILATLGNKSSSSSAGLVLCNLVTSQYVSDNVSHKFEIDEVIASEERRQIELRWTKQGDDKRWFSSRHIYDEILHDDRKFWPVVSEMRDRIRQTRQYVSSYDGIHTPRRDFKTHGLGDAKVFIVNRERYLTFDAPLTAYLSKLEKSEEPDTKRVLAATFALLESLRDWRSVTPEMLERIVSNTSGNAKPYLRSVEELAEAIRNTGRNVFDPFAWDRRDSNGYNVGSTYFDD